MKIFAIMYPTPCSLSHAHKNAQKIKKMLFLFTKRTRQFFKSKEVLMLLAVYNKSGKLNGQVTTSADMESKATNDIQKNWERKT